ncbi:CHAT domain-containing protein [Jiella sp. CBK1P-4]|uniref:CHAT domain-containing protein n=2 Tax=Jiella avicenniae TaxID=2907202 RepID=A0A9X1NWU6_9HYPH|nr:CHAT domain-containing protein [Jiella avicenniae]
MTQGQLLLGPTAAMVPSDGKLSAILRAALALVFLVAAAPLADAQQSSAAPSAEDGLSVRLDAYRAGVAAGTATDAAAVIEGYRLAAALYLGGRLADARELYLGLETTLPKVFGPDGEEVAQLAADMAVAWEAAGDRVGALAYAAKSDDLYARRAPNAARRIKVALQRARLEGERGSWIAALARTEEIARLIAAAGAKDPRLSLALHAIRIEGFFNRRDHAGLAAEVAALKADVEATDAPVGPEPLVFAELKLAFLEERWEDAAAAVAGLRQDLEASRQTETLDYAHSLYDAGYVSLVRSHFRDAVADLNDALLLYERLSGPDDPMVARSSLSLALAHQELGEPRTALAHYQRALTILSEAYGPNALDVATTKLETVRLHLRLGDPQTGERVAREGLAALEKAEIGDSRLLALGHFALALALQAGDRLREALTETERAVAILKREADRKGTALTLPLITSAELHHALAEDEAALTAIDAAIDLSGRHGMAADTRALTVKAQILAAMGRTADALAAARAATANLAGAGLFSGEETTIAAAEQRIARPTFETHLALLAERPKQTGSDLDEAFGLAQRAIASVTGRVAADLSARFSGAGPKVEALVRQRQDAARQLASVERRESDALAGLGDEGSGEGLAKEARRLRAEVGDLDAAIASQYPAYRRALEPVGLAALQSALRPDEALIVEVVAADRTHLFLISRNGAALKTGPLGRRDVAALVTRIRRSVAFPQWGELPAFDLDAANALYAATFGPFGAELGRYRHLIVVPDGAMQSLPPGILPQTPAAPGADYRTVDWLGLSHAISIVPGVDSFVSARETRRPSRANRLFAGFGDPLFAGAEATASGAATPQERRVRAILAAAPPLPETQIELKTMQSVLDGGTLFLGNEATLASVQRAKLSNYRILAFATHAVTAGTIPGVDEPAILLAAGGGGPKDDGILTASRIAALDLDAEFVVLSACDTAASNGEPNAEGLSGLAQAFFHAGARSLLVSHWPIASEATVGLTTRTVALAARDGVPKAEALRRSMAAMVAENPQWSHPAYWGPFSLVGDGWE